MESLVVASSAEDSDAVDRLGTLNAEVLAGVTARADVMLSGEDLGAARDALARWNSSNLLPFVAHKAEQMATAARPIAEVALLAESLEKGVRAISDVADVISTSDEALRVVGAAQALKALVAAQFASETDLLVPTLAAASDVDLAQIVDEAAEKANAEPAAGHGHGEHACNCGESDSEGWPELDARIVPHAIRHATVFGALDAVGPGKGMILIAPHDPLPLLGQIEQRNPGLFEVSYLERGPEAWRLQFLRRA